MIVECPTCAKKYNFPDDRLKSLKKRTFNCPACEGLVTIDLPSDASERHESSQELARERQIDPSEELMT